MQISLNDLMSAVSSALDAVEYEFYGARKYHARRVAMLSVGMLEELWWRAVPGGVLAAHGLKAKGTLAAHLGGALAQAKSEGKSSQLDGAKEDRLSRGAKEDRPLGGTKEDRLSKGTREDKLAKGAQPDLFRERMHDPLRDRVYNQVLNQGERQEWSGERERAFDLPHLVDLTDMIDPQGACLSGEAWADINADSILGLFGAAVLHDSGLTKYYRELGKQKPGDVVQELDAKTPRAEGSTAAAMTGDVAASATTEGSTAAAMADDAAAGGTAESTEAEETRVAAEPIEFLTSHCEEGERIISIAPFYDKVRGAVLYHHENADGSGPFGKTAEETPLFARLIHIADVVDVRFSLDDVTPDKYAQVVDFVVRHTGMLFDKEVADALLCAFPPTRMASLGGEQLLPQLKAVLPDVFVDYSVSQLAELGGVIAQITDYKSTFTSNHSRGVARRVRMLAEYEGMDADLCGRLYIAGSLHDIGKLFVPTDILEKPGRLTPEEFEKMKYHAKASWDIIGSIRGMEQIQPWAALHHEKLDGAGYPFGLTGDELDHEDRMMAIADIYQALTEYRPYRTADTHDEAIEIMRKMATLGKIDAELVEEASDCFADGDMDTDAE